MEASGNKDTPSLKTLKSVLLILLFISTGCGPFARLDTKEKKENSPQTILEKEYHQSLYWGGNEGIYVSIDKGSSKIGGQKYAKVKVMNFSGKNLLLNTDEDRYWFERYGIKYSMYRRMGGRYPNKISDKRNLEFELLGIDSFTAVDSITIMFSMMDSLIINSRLRQR